MEKASQLSHLPNVKKMIAKGNYYRLRIGIYRLGLIVENDTIILLRFVHRKDIYNYFP
jgi:mRNA interferase RelE/StbE